VAGRVPGSVKTVNEMECEKNGMKQRHIDVRGPRPGADRRPDVGLWGAWAQSFWIAALATVSVFSSVPSRAAETAVTSAPPAWLTQPMSLVDSLNVALRQNGAILKGQSALEAAHGVVIQTRAIAYPKVRGMAGYAHDEAVERSPSIGGVNPPEDQWSGTIRIQQAVYEGGRIRSALRSARLTQDQALLQYQVVVADTLLAVRLAYYDVLLAEQQIVVQEASVKLLTQELENTTQRFKAGAVPRFDVLRAEVAVANERPKLIRARNACRTAKNNLATVLGYTVPMTIWEDIPLTLTGKLEAQPYSIELPTALAQALGRRPELGVLRKEEGLRKEGIVSAKSRYVPWVGIFAGYGAGNSRYEEDFWTVVSGPKAGLALEWDIWDGNLTKGKVIQARALLQEARVQLDNTTRDVQLQVRTAYSSFLEAREVLESQKKVLEQAEEALRLAVSRYDAGSSTQLDVLNAETALTEARTTQIQALHDYDAARARLGRAIGEDVPQEPAQAGPK
jgi:outer membrane protein